MDWPVLAALNPELSIAGLLAVGVGLWTFRLTRRSLSRLLAMVRTTSRPVAEIEPGYVEIEGEVVSAGESIEGKLTGESAVVTEYRQGAGDDDNEETVPNIPLPNQLVPTAFNRGAVPFYVEDETGRVLVDAATAELSLRSDAKRDPAGRDREVEARLEPGDHVYVLGTAVTVAEYSPRDSSDGFLRTLLGFFLGEHRRLQASAVVDDEELVITKQGGSAFLISDTSEWRGWIRQGLMATIWGIATLVFVVGGAYHVLAGLTGLAPLV